MNTLLQQYRDSVAPALIKKFALTNSFATPKLKKIVINMGVSDPAEPRARKQALENIAQQFQIISGQKAQITVAKKSIANFKLRLGDPMGVMVTLRGDYMWEFLQKLVGVALPRVKDFTGVSRTAFDGNGNYSMSIEEQIIFPEIDYDQIERIRSFQVNMVTNTHSDEQAFALLELLGIPFAKPVEEEK